ncbi:hypothetical protein DNU06_01750 [Putridiphycobacter roseus]|uniref:Uncharacterized protein n=1 Tax=Putridiphycobacter roseus TaxID=2219161 RepID=A0A2W1N4R9_9FLAO|nr:hypothetical protein [Putridiphycobacter roseus]PZE18580.1 hypothetical protein DNU06_01750 [Putridiphycobacter roseus]
MNLLLLKNKILFFFIFLSVVPLYGVGDAEAKQIESDKRKVINKVLEWSDSVFYFHEDYRFEKFQAHYTDDFYIILARSDQYKKKVDDLKALKEEGRFEGSEQAYNAQLKVNENKYRKFQIIVDSYAVRARFFEIIFWSNIKTKHGYNVYYGHRIKLSNDLVVMAALVIGSIGNKSMANTIIYN